MTATVATAPEQRIVTRSTWRAVLVLGTREGRRMLLSPVLLVLLGFILLMVGVETVRERAFELPTAGATYDVITFFTALYLGLLMYVTAHLVTSSARRTKAEPQLAASTLTERQRNIGLCLGVLFGPGLLALVLMVTAALLGNSLTVTSFSETNGEPPTAGIILGQLGLTLVGAGLFGVMWATWLRFPGSLPIGFVALVFVTVWLSNGDREPLNTWPWFAPYISSPEWFDEAWTAYGSHYWHAAYLVGLCGLAFCATMLRSREHRVRWVGISAGVVVATGVVGAVQLA